MRLRIPDKIKQKLSMIVSLIVIIILLVAIWYIYPSLFQSVPPKRTEWAYSEIQIKEMNNDGLFGEGATVAIIDTGIDLNHPELRHVNLVAWRDLINREPEPYDDDGHGTAMAGIIAGKTYGVAPAVDLIVVKAIDALAGATDTNIYTAIRFCMQNGADIISMSLGRDEVRVEDLSGPWQDSTLEDVCNEAVQAGIFMVAAAGNDGGQNDDGEVSVPSVHEKTISVGAVDEDLTIAGFSSEGENDGKLPNIISNWDPWERDDPDKKPELVAPGVDIVAPGLDEKYYTYSGTSLAVPFVAGGLALILGELTQYQQENNAGEATITKVKDNIMKTSQKSPRQETPHDNRYGYGLFQAMDLFEALEE
jgi:subtilisin family serine protease